MDNDVHGTDYCIGFSTAVTRTVNFIHQLRTSAGSHERLAVVEVFGRYSGETSLDLRLPVGRRPGHHLRGPLRHRPADRAADGGQAGQPERLRHDDDLRGRHASSAARWCMRGEADAYGHRKLGGIGELTGELLRERTGEGIIVQQLGYLMRSGNPDSLDLMVAVNYGVMAADLLLEGSSGRLVALRNGQLRQRADQRHPPGREAGRRRRALRRRAPTAPRSATSTANPCSCIRPSSTRPRGVRVRAGDRRVHDSRT